ncbi:MAG: iron ABC transporter permease [Paludibacteraceae bacterium]|nr:iron ABC transporter permease [Paludibacteraceae bacterium]MBR1480789.1 iron ABC transporter permease [Paludibacteraceae bacterium]
MNRTSVLIVCSSLLLFFLLWLDLSCGAVWIPLSEWWQHPDALTARILLNLRLPKALTAVLAGAALSVSGLMMQTLFRNPLAGPYILGVSSGASLGVALVTLCASFFGITLAGGGIIPAAIIGSTLVLLLVLLVSRRIESNVSLLIVGMMLGSVAGALVSLLQNFANPDALKLFIVWTLGSLSSVGWSELGVLAAVVLVGLTISILLIKPLNGLSLGENYAQALGIHVPHIRLGIVLATGLLAGGVTAYCGPIAFVGVAVPHIARGLARSSNHLITLPASILIGADLLLLCDILSSLFTYPLPISTISALFGAPIIIWIILRH